RVETTGTNAFITDLVDSKDTLDRLTGGHTPPDLRRGGRDLGWFALGANHERASREVGLLERQERRRERCGIQSAVLRVADNADDRAPITGDTDELEDIACPRHASADWIRIAEQQVRSGLVQD